MTTLNQACKAIVSAAIDHEYASLEFFSEIVPPNEALKSVYQAEHDYNECYTLATAYGSLSSVEAVDCFISDEEKQ